MDADICIVMNAGSGKGDAQERRRALEAACAGFPGRFELRPVRHGSDIERVAREAVEEGFETIVAAGGDGTIATVASVLAGTGRRMAVLPFGTFNYFARSLGLPEDIEEAVRTIAEGRVRVMDTADVNGRIFLNNASLGAYPAILNHREQVFRRWGRSKLLAYLITLTTLLQFRSPLVATLRVDGTERRVRSPLVFICKNAGQLEEMELEGGDCIRSGRFAVFVAPDAGRFGLILFAFRLALHLTERRTDFELLCGQEVEIETARPWRLVARDGEREKMQGPFRFRLHPGALRIVVPPEAEKA